jgi:intracellular septation protein A
MALHHNRLAIGMGLLGAFMALGNYLVANNFSEDFWLTYSTLLEFPISMVALFLIMRWAKRG